nr:MAG: polymerase PB1 [Xinjiang sediment orthomyxo-like virus 1]
MNFFNSVPDRSLEVMVPHWYSYTAPPPIRTGSYTRKVVNTIKRSAQYGNGFGYETDGLPSWVKRNCNVITENEVNGLIQRELVCHNARKYHAKYSHTISTSFQKWFNWIQITSTTALTSGRQTYCIALNRNVPAPQAYENFLLLLSKEETILHKTYFYMIGHCTSFLRKLEDKPTVSLPYSKGVKRNKSGVITQTSLGWKEMETEDFTPRVFTLSTFIKQLERGQLEARSIASPNMFFRVYVTAFEQLAKFLLESMDENAIALGSIDKQSVIRSIKATKVGHYNILGITGDNSKWNECINIPSVCALIHMISKGHLYDQDRDEVYAFLKVVANLFQNKRLAVGPGVSLVNDYGIYKLYKMSEILEKEVPEFIFLKGHYDNNTNTVPLGPGMVMGMANIGSTLFALVCTLEDSLKKLQSSDDWYGFTDGKNWDDSCRKYMLASLYEKLCGMNDSHDKTFAIEGGNHGEYNALYWLGEFLSNVSTDLPCLIPAGKNPIDDWNILLKFLREMISKGALTPSIVPLALWVCERTYRAAYHCYPTADSSVRTRGRFISTIPNLGEVHICHGGPQINSTSSLHLDPISLLWKMGKIDKSYVRRMYNPQNPTNFTVNAKEMLVFDASKKKIVEEDFSPNAMKIWWVENRTALQSSSGQKMVATSAEYQKGIKAIDKICPELLRLPTNSADTVFDTLFQRIISDADRCKHEFDEAQLRVWEKCCGHLNRIVEIQPAQRPGYVASMERHLVLADEENSDMDITSSEEEE